MIDFRSDNTGRAAPEILDALVRANSGTALGYGADEWTARLQERFSELFETRVRVFPVATGTAANALSLGRGQPVLGPRLLQRGGAHQHGRGQRRRVFRRRAQAGPGRRRDGKIDADALARRARGDRAGPDASRPAGGGQYDPGERSRRGLPARRDPRDRRGRQSARPQGAYGRRPLRQCVGAARLQPGRAELALPASTSCRSARPRTAARCAMRSSSSRRSWSTGWRCSCAAPARCGRRCASPRPS